MAVKTYSDEERTRALALLQVNNGNLRLTATQTGIAPSSLLAWRNLGLAASADSEHKDRHSAMWAEAGALGAQLIADQLARALEADERLPAKDVRDYAVAAGISTDKHLDYRDGRKGAQIDARQVHVHVAPEQARAALEMLAEGAIEAIEGPASTAT